MKVLSIKEPFATLILNKEKLIETRSWKTNYRGELFIHASKSNMDKELLKELKLKESDMHYGNIICRCKLTDCVCMDEKFLKEIKKNKKEYSLGIYELGRYAWILEDIEPITAIPTNGKLNIWNYN